MTKPLTLTSANFKKEVLESGTPVLVDFWASWCPPCKMMDPMVDELADEYSGIIKVGKLNVDQNPEISGKFSIEGVPTFITFKSSEVVGRKVGAQSKEQIKEMIEELINIKEL